MSRWLAFFCLSGCVTSAAVSAAHPRSPGWEGPVVVRIPERGGTEGMMGLPRGSLTSEVALVDADDKTVCFDLKMRTWQGATPQWDLELSIDDKVVQRRFETLAGCTQASLEPSEPIPMTLEMSCLPSDSVLGTFATDARDPIKVRGGRVCMEHRGRLTLNSDSLVLSVVQGAMSYEFAWQLRSRPAD